MFSFKWSIASKKAFTLVELIVVITILAILAAVGFVIMSHQTSVARDGKRISEIQSLSSASRITTAQLRELPRPIADSLELTVSGSFIGYQGFMSTALVNPLGYGSDKIYDPLDGTPYTYRVNQHYDSAQFMAYLENPRFERSIEIAGIFDELLPQAYALDTSTIDLSKRYPYAAGDRLWIFLKRWTNEPLQSWVSGTGTQTISTWDNSTLRVLVSEDTYLWSISTEALTSMQNGSFSNDALLAMNSGTGSGSGSWSGSGGNSCPINPTDESYFTFDSNNGTIIWYDAVNGPLNVVIPCAINGVNVINIWWAAFLNKQLASLVIPNSVTTIEGYAFYGNQLTSLTIPNSLTSIGKAAFNNNKLPDGQAFVYARNINGWEDQTTVVSYGGERLENVMIPNNIVNIGDSAFSWVGLTSVTIPASVVSIGDEAFYNNGLTAITIGSGVISIWNGAFSTNQLTSLVIPNGVVSIGDNAFWFNQLTSVNIPASVASIGSIAFRNNRIPSGNDIVIHCDMPTFSWLQVFEYNWSDGSLHIPNPTTCIP